MRMLDPDDPLLEMETFHTNTATRKHKVPSVEELNYRYHSYDPKKYMVKQEQYLIRKNLLVLCAAFLLNSTAFHTIQYLQRSINPTGGLGLVGQAIVYFAVILSSLFLPTVCVRRLGCKWSVALGFIPATLYAAAAFYPTWATVVPAAFGLGLARAVLVAARGTYIAQVGSQAAALGVQPRDAQTARFFGYFFMAYQTAHIWSNLVASFIILHPNNDTPEDNNGTDTVMMESTWGAGGGAKDYSTCGKFHCDDVPWNIDEIANAEFSRPDTHKLYILCGVLTGLSLLAFLITAIFLDKLKKRIITDPIEMKVFAEVAHGQSGVLCRQITATLRHWRHCNQLLLVPITLFHGLQQAFFAADFTRSYVSCSLGVWMVGMVLICYGATSSLFAFLFGRLTKYTGQPLILAFGTLCQLGCLLGLFFWDPHPAELYLFFIIATLWGMADAVWHTQIPTFYGCVFLRRKEAAFSNYCLWETLGMAAIFATTGFLCTHVKICVLIGMLLLGMMGYFVVECRRRFEEEEMEEERERREKY